MGNIHAFSPRLAWVDNLRRFVEPYWDALLNGDFAESAAYERLTIDELRGWMLHMYPFIHTFPKFLAEALIKAEDDESRAFLIDNIRVERAHAEHWIWMAEGFGLRRADLLALAAGDRPALRDVQSLTDWLWYINTKGTLVEGVAATSYAIEGVTGDLTRKTLPGFLGYGRYPEVVMDNRTSRWMRSHARYDDEHPKLALEVIKRCATSERLQHKAMLAAKRSLQLLDLAMNTSYRAYTESPATASGEVEQRLGDRRKVNSPTGFPERRFGERRGRVLRAIA